MHQERAFHMSQEERRAAIQFIDSTRFNGEAAILNHVADEVVSELKHLIDVVDSARAGGLDDMAFARVMIHAKLAFSASKLSPISSAGIQGAAKAAFRLSPESLQAARMDPICFDVACSSIGICIEHEMTLTAEARAFIVGVLTGELKRPRARKGISRYSQMFRDGCIVAAIEIGQFFGLPATRNDASDETSGCDAVAGFFQGRNTAPMTFSAVKRIWLARGHTFRRFSITMNGTEK